MKLLKYDLEIRKCYKLRLENFSKNKSWFSNYSHNPPNDYEVVLLVIIWNNTFYDKKVRIIKKCYVGRHNLLQSQM